MTQIELEVLSTIQHNLPEINDRLERIAVALEKIAKNTVALTVN